MPVDIKASNIQSASLKAKNSAEVTAEFHKWIYKNQEVPTFKLKLVNNIFDRPALLELADLCKQLAVDLKHRKESSIETHTITKIEIPIKELPKKTKPIRR